MSFAARLLSGFPLGFSLLLFLGVGLSLGVRAEASCPEAPTSSYQCRGAKLVTNQSELDAYLSDFAHNSKKGFIRGLRLQGEFSGQSLKVATPCKIILTKNTTLDIAGDICLVSNDKVVAREGLTLNGFNALFKAPNKVVIQNSATINMSGDLELLSHGATAQSRAHIRHSSNIHAANLKISGLRRSTLGRESVYEVAGKISILSTGDERPTDEDISEWSTVWRDTIITAGEFEALALWRIKIGKNTNISATKITLDGHGCKFGKKSVLDAPEKLGRCMLPNRPVSKMRIRPKEIFAGEEVTLDATRSLNGGEGATYRWRIYPPNGGRINTKKRQSPLYKFIPQQAGVYSIEQRVYTSGNFHAWKKRKINVLENPNMGSKSLSSYFKFFLNEEDGQDKLTLIYEGRDFNNYRQIVEAYYLYPNEVGEEVRHNVGRRVLGHRDILSFNKELPFDITLVVVDNLGNQKSFTHRVGPREEFQSPHLYIESIEYAPNELVFFSNSLFDPYRQLSEYPSYTLEFGDGAQSDFGATPFQESHHYNESGIYTAKVKSEGFETSRDIFVSGQSTPFIYPYVDFKVDQKGWMPGVRLYLNQVINPDVPIQSAYWDLGDGTYAYSPEVLHFYEDGAYDVTLSVTLADGRTSTVTREVIIMNSAQDMMGELNCFESNPLQGECHVSVVDRFHDLESLSIHFGESEFLPENMQSIPFTGQWASALFRHDYASAGTYTVTFKAMTTRGQEYLLTTNLKVASAGNQAPLAYFDYFIEGNNATFNSNFSYDPDGYITNYHFDFGDGVTLNTIDTEVYHHYENEGSYRVSLSVTDNFGLTSFTSQDILVGEAPNQLPEPDLYCYSSAPQQLSCEGEGSFDPDGEIVLGRLTALETGETFESDNISVLEKIFSFNSAGIKTILLEVTDNFGAIVSLERSFEVQVNQKPVPIMTCFSQNNGELSCNGISSYDDGEIISYEWLINGEVYTGVSIVASGILKSSVPVALSVTDNLGETALVEDVFAVKTNKAPIADFSCSSLSPWLLNCSNNSSDPDGDYLSYTWEVEGNTYSRKSLVLSNLGHGGVVNVSLTVFDGNVSATKTEQVNILENDAPLLTLTCESNENLLVTCNASATDSEGISGNIEWFINGEKSEKEGHYFSDYIFTKNATVKVVAKDYLGLSGFSETELLVNRDGIIGEIRCSQSGNYIANCSFGLRGIGDAPRSISWKVDGVSFGAEESIVVTTTEEREISLEVELDALDDTFIFNKAFPLVTIPNSNLPSPATLSLVTNAPFVKNEATLEFNLQGGNFLIDEQGRVKDFNLYVDEGEVVSYKIVESSLSSVKVSAQLKDGRSELYISARDEENKEINFSEEVFVGSKTLTVNIANVASERNISFYFTGESEAYLILPLNSQSITIENFPDQEVVYSVGAYPTQSLGLIRTGETIKDILISDEDLTPALDSLNFDNGVMGWNIQKGDVFERDAIDTKLLFNEEASSLKFVEDGEGKFLASTLFEASEEGYLSLPVGLENLKKESVFFLYAKNLSTGEESTIRLDKSNFRFDGIYKENLSLPYVESGQKVFVKVLWFTPVAEQTVFQRLQDILPFDVAFAQEDAASAANLMTHRYFLYRFFQGSLRDGQQHDIGKKLKTFIQGQFPFFYNQWNSELPHQKVYKVYLKGLASFTYDFLNLYSQKIEICSAGVIGDCQFIKDINCSEADYNSEKGCLIEFTENEVNYFSNTPFININLHIIDRLSRLRQSSVIRGSKYKRNFRIIRSASVDGLIGGRNDSEDRYGARQGGEGLDGEDGTDDWYAPTHRNLIINLMNAKNTYNGVVHSLKVDDISPTGHSSPEGFGHKGHGEGIQMDLRFIKNKSPYTEIESEASDDINSFKEDAVGIVNILNAGNGYIERLLISNRALADGLSFQEKLEGVARINKPFLNHLSTSCTSYGEYPLSVIENSLDHSNHADIEFADINSKGIIYRKNFRSQSDEMESLGRPFFNLGNYPQTKTIVVSNADLNGQEYLGGENDDRQLFLFYKDLTSEGYPYELITEDSSKLFYWSETGKLKVNRNHSTVTGNSGGGLYKSVEFKSMSLRKLGSKLICNRYTSFRTFSIFMPIGSCSEHQVFDEELFTCQGPCDDGSARVNGVCEYRPELVSQEFYISGEGLGGGAGFLTLEEFCQNAIQQNNVKQIFTVNYKCGNDPKRASTARVGRCEGDGTGEYRSDFNPPAVNITCGPWDGGSTDVLPYPLPEEAGD